MSPGTTMRTFAPTRLPAAQRGVATLFITIVLMLAVGLIALYTNRAAIMEQRLSANEIRAKQALAAANAGIEHALAYLRQAGGLDHNNDGTVDAIASDTLTSSGTNAQPSYYRAYYCDAVAHPTPALIPACKATHTDTTFACTAPASVTQVVAIGCGWSDDDASVQRVVQMLKATSSLGGTISTPVITRGTANLLTGGASILNYFNDLTVWSGGSLLGQSNTGKTFIRNEVTNPTASDTDAFVENNDYRDVGTSPACNNPPTGYQCSTQGSTLGHDTVGGDTNLSSMSVDAYFQYFFGQTPAAYKNGTANVVAAANASTLVNMSGAIWVEGNTSLPGGTIGTQTNPVILIINGDLDLGANTVINGLVYVTGTISGNGSPTIYGALVGAGSANVTGNLKVVYDPKVLGAAPSIGKAGKVQGSWRDW